MHGAQIKVIGKHDAIFRQKKIFDKGDMAVQNVNFVPKFLQI